MKKVILVFAIFLLNSTLSSFGQNDCNTKSIIGEWKILKCIHWGIHTNVDSLRNISHGDKSLPVLTIQFCNDNTYKIGFENKKKQIGYYLFDAQKCEIILNKKKKRLTIEKYRKKSNWEIIYIDHEILIYKENNNPKSYATHVLLKN